jgi:hypothetical protein
MVAVVVDLHIVEAHQDDCIRSVPLAAASGTTILYNVAIGNEHAVVLETRNLHITENEGDNAPLVVAYVNDDTIARSTLVLDAEFSRPLKAQVGHRQVGSLIGVQHCSVHPDLNALPHAVDLKRRLTGEV